jgi:mono/diheme cytochrome c family protein
MRRLAARSLALAGLVALAGCDDSEAWRHLSPGWERMQVQARGETFGESAVFADGRAMRTPPPGTLPRTAEDVPGDSLADGGYVDTIPEPVDAAMLARGRARFESVCAACHGIRGDGDSVVASKMQQRRPPSLHEERIRMLADGEIAAIIRRGYGFMPALASSLDARDRWDVVAYVRALQASQVSRAQLTPAEVSALAALPDRAAPTPPKRPAP